MRCFQGENAQLADGVRAGQGRERSRSSGHAIRERAGGNHFAGESVRSIAVFSEPERVGPAAPLYLVQQPRHRREDAAGGEARSSRSVRGERSALCAR